MYLVFSHINFIAILFSGFFYALLSKVWFADFFLGRFYQGVFCEDLFTNPMKFRSALIRFIAGVLIGFVISAIIIVTEISSVKAAAEMGLLLSIVPSIISVIQLFYARKQVRWDTLIEMGFQVVSIETISLIIVLMTNKINP